jgi:hypothetical protein
MKRRQVTNGMVELLVTIWISWWEIPEANLRISLVRSLLVEVGENDGEDEESIGTTP